MIQGPMEVFEKNYAQRDLAARKWQARGRKVIGYMCNAVPEELIIAAGALPVRITGTPGAPIDTMVKYVGSTAYAEGFMSTMLNGLVTGQFDYLDYLVLPQTRNTEESQYGHLEMIRELWPESNIPPIHKIDEAQTWSHTGVEHYYKQLKRFTEKLTQWTGYCISDRRIRDAIDICNENRALLKKVQQYRLAGKVTGQEMLMLVSTSFWMEKEEHNQYLRMLLRTLEERPASDAVPVYVDGSPLDHLALYTIIESCGARVVDEDNCWGMRSVEDMVDLERFPDPTEALAQRYHYRKPCPYLYFPAGARCEYCKEKLADTPAKGVIYYAMCNDAAQHWDYAMKKDEMTRSLPVLPLLNESYELTDRDALTEKIKAFVQSL